MRLFLLLGLASYCLPVSATTISRSAMTHGLRQGGECVAPAAANSFPSSIRQVYLWFEARSVQSGDSVRADWYSPDGALYTSSPWGELPSAVSLCLTAALPISGYAPAYAPGIWTAKIVWNEQILKELPFRITGGGPTGGLSIQGVSRSRIPAGEADLTITGSGFRTDSTVQVEVLASEAGWRSFSSLRPVVHSAQEMTVHLVAAEPAEYRLKIVNPGGQHSAPRNVMVGYRGFRMPLAAGERWQLTQGNVGRYSHDGNTIYAYDFAPRGARCVTAMKAGIAHVHDVGLGQTPHLRSFGNYITIDHGNGNYSHYAHLMSGTFVVAEGQHVEAGQALAQVGTSGFSFGTHLHVQVTRAYAISSQSVPFLFEDVNSYDPPGPPPGQPVVRANTFLTASLSTPLCDCRAQPGPLGAPQAMIVRASNTGMRPFKGHVETVKSSFAELQWWSELISVPRTAGHLQVTLTWEGAANLDLHLMSPSGKHYGWSGITNGYSGDRQPEEFRLPRPEPGIWRVAVQARSAPLGTPPFSVATLTEP